MKFLLRCLLVLAVAVGFSLVLYYAVQALPGGPDSNQQNVNVQPEGANNSPVNPPGTERPEKDRGAGLRLRSILGFARRTLVFSILVFAAILGKNFIFERKSNPKKTKA